MTAPDPFDRLVGSLADLYEALDRVNEAAMGCLDLDGDERAAGAVLLVGVQSVVPMVTMGLLLGARKGRGLLRQTAVAIAGCDIDSLREAVES